MLIRQLRLYLSLIRTSSTSRISSDRWFDERANLRFHRTLRCRPLDRRAEELTVMRPLPDRVPDVDRRWVTRIAPDPVRVAGGDLGGE
jgi:hypothetical protein